KQDGIDNSKTSEVSWLIKAKYINQTYMNYEMKAFHNNGSSTYFKTCSVRIMVTQPRRKIDLIFKGLIPFIIGFIAVQMGVLLEMSVLKEIVQRPLPVLIGFVTQYGLMPLIAFSITKIFRYPPLYGLGLFVVGCCPGGTASNQWTLIFDGDINLSACMSFASTMASFFMMPFWFYTLGKAAYLKDLKIYIPYMDLVRSLATIIVPIGVGMFIAHFFPKVKVFINKIVKPTMIFCVFFFFIFGTFVHLYLFKMVSLAIALSAPLLPWLGFILGGFFAWICRQDWRRVKTIAIETGIQNVGIAFMVLLYSFPEPENVLATVMPFLVASLAVQPFHIMLVIRFIDYKFCSLKKKKNKKINQRDDQSDDTGSKTTNRLTDESDEKNENNDDELKNESSDEQRLPTPLFIDNNHSDGNNHVEETAVPPASVPAISSDNPRILV
ncbi:unnamed protein product, partial [Didymodactylos carnosus]